jgi:hypothetical protein
MIPRFSNPHILQKSTKLTSRADLRGSDLDDIDVTREDVPILTKRLRELVHDDLGNFTFASGENLPRIKRQKLECGSTDVMPETQTPIRACVLLRQLP